MARQDPETRLEQVKDAARMILLFDYYGQLLNAKQQDVFRLYHEENLTLYEIAIERGISRQGVHVVLKKAESMLNRYEEVLQLVGKHRACQQALLAVRETVRATRTEQMQDRETLEENLKKISDIIASLEI